MTEQTDIIDQPQDVAPVESPAISGESTAAPTETTDLDSLLAQYNASVKPEPANNDARLLSDAPVTDQQSLDQLLRDSENQQRIDELSGQNAQLLEQINEQRVQKAYSDLTADIQREVPHASQRAIENELEARAARNPEVLFAWRNQFADTNAANLKLLEVDARLDQLRRNPALAGPKEVQKLTQDGYQLGLVLNASKIIARERAGAIRELRGEPPEIDWSATHDRNMVAASVRDGGSRGKAPPTPPINWGALEPYEYRREVKRLYGYDPGT
jgi:hypothetical protein